MKFNQNTFLGRLAFFSALCIFLSVSLFFYSCTKKKNNELTQTESLALTAGETFALQTAEGCEFSSSAPQIAKVDANGVVTAVSEGETQIMLKKDALTQTVAVTVSDPAIINFDIRNESHINWYGRTYKAKAPDGRESVMFPLSNSSFEVSFYGNKLTATIYCYVDPVRKGQKTYFSVTVDHRTRTVGLDDGINELVLGERLTAGKHKASVVKLTEGRESNAGLLELKGESADGNFRFVKPPEKPSLKLEFYGDSLTTGHGVKGSNSTTAFETVNEDPTLCYAGVATKLLNAQATIYAYSGISLAVEGRYYPPLMKDVYRYVCSSNCREEWDFSRYVPDVIVVNLGANDWSSIKNVYWEQREEKVRKFSEAYVDFIRTLQEIAPNAKIVCITDRYQIGREIDDKIEAAAKMTGVYCVELYSNSNGSAGHPDTEAGQIAGKQLADFINSILQESGAIK